MNTEINQKISSFSDGELNASEEEAVLVKMRKDKALAKTLNRYHMVSQVVKNETCIHVNENFLDKIKQAVEEEPHYLLPKNQVNKVSTTDLWRKASLAIAASTIFAVVLVSQKVEVEVAEPTLPVLAETTQSVQPDAMRRLVKTETKIEVAGDLQDIQQAIQHERLKAYLKTHSDNLYAQESLKFQVPYARVVSQE